MKHGVSTTVIFNYDVMFEPCTIVDSNTIILLGSESFSGHRVAKDQAVEYGFWIGRLLGEQHFSHTGEFSRRGFSKSDSAPVLLFGDLRVWKFTSAGELPGFNSFASVLLSGCLRLREFSYTGKFPALSHLASLYRSLRATACASQ